MRKTIALNFDWEFYPQIASYADLKSYIEPNNETEISRGIELNHDSDSSSDHQLDKKEAIAVQIVDIPHNMQDIAINNFDESSYQHTSAYRKVIPSQLLHSAKHALLNFHGVANSAHVWVNGVHVGSNYCGYLPFDIDIRQAANGSDDVEVVVLVDANEDTLVPPFGHVVDFLTYGGIYREVELILVDNVYIDNCQIQTPGAMTNSGNVVTNITLSNPSNITLEGELTVSIYDSMDTLITQKSESIEVAETSSCHTVELKCEHIRQWDVDFPNLYRLEVVLTGNGNTNSETVTGLTQRVDTQVFRFGFREVEFKPEGFYLNGRLLKLIGLNRHQSFPYVGYAMPKSAQVRDADILKQELGCNCVRSSHYPPSKHFLDRCDEIGLLVFNEIPGWQHVSHDKIWRSRTLDNTRRMVMRDWNHPSIFIWGVRVNESPDCPDLYRETNRIARELDPTRPTGGVRCIKNSELLEDVYTYNDFSHTGNNAGLELPTKVIGKRAPYLVSEHNGHMFPTKAFDSQERLLSHALRHAKVIDDAFGQAGQAGAIGWCMSDYNTHEDFGSGDGICYHGVLDMFREPKYAASVYASQQANTPVMTLASNTKNGDYSGAQFGAVLVFTNCEYVKMYKNGLYINTFYPDKASYPHMPHAPVVIDDFIGEQLATGEGYSSNDAENLRQLFRVITRSGIEGLTFTQKLNLYWRMKKNGLSEQDMIDLFIRYIGNWGEETATYLVEGFRSDECVVSQTFGKSRRCSIQIAADSNTLIESDTYDVTRVVVRVVDEDTRIKNYATNPIHITTSEQLKVIGPSDVSLSAGRVAFWVRTTGIKGQGIVTVSTPQFESRTVDITCR